MPIDVTKVLVGAPDQATTGAVFDAPLGTKLPTSAGDELDEAFVSSGYITSDGLALTPDRSTSDITDWSGASVRTLLESFNATIKWSEMQMSYEALVRAFGKDNVTRTAADSTHGERITIKVNASLPEPRVHAFRIKDGKARVLIVAPNSQVTAVDEIGFSASAAIALPITLSCHPDESGNSVYIYTDDGVVSA